MAANLPPSPLAPPVPECLPDVAGVQLAAVASGVRYRSGRLDTLLALMPAGTSVAGVFTTSRTASPAVVLSRQAIVDAGGRARVLLVSAGNSIAGTGAGGMAACRAIMARTAEATGCAPAEVQFGATGVIGEPFPVDTLLDALPNALQRLGQTGWHDAARAIMTTDTFPKLASRTARIGDASVTLNGIVKGSGMIMPNMATMLGYIFTDAAIAPPVLQALLSRANAATFNCITVDSDTSTSDTVLVFATGSAPGQHEITDTNDPALTDFASQLEALCLELAQLVVRDGEGAQKFITIQLTGAACDADAHTLAMSIANSPLVKTAIAGADANWGRIVMAVGKAGPKIEPDKLSVSFGGTPICQHGQRVPGYDEAPVAAHLNGRDIDIAVDVGTGGPGKATVYTCDLTHGYIDINADYRS